MTTRFTGPVNKLCLLMTGVVLICPVCRWENDVFIKSDDEPSDENRGMTLNQARANYKKCGIANPQFITERVDRLDIGWQDIVKGLSRNAKTFEIHCWNEEIEWIELALKYGTIKEDSWELGKVISGDKLKLSAITSGGSNALFFKVNTWGEEAFLDKIKELL